MANDEYDVITPPALLGEVITDEEADIISRIKPVYYFKAGE
jgi:hypothetical protein